MGSILSPVTDAIGLTDHKGEEAAREASAQASQQSLALTQEELAFQREQYYDWKDIYGDLQDQIDEYYKQYTGEDVVSRRLAETSTEFQGAEKQLTRNLAQRGLTGSGLEAAGLTQLAGQEAAAKAGIRGSQEDVAIQKRLQFLGLGLGQGTQMLGTQAGVAQTGISSQASIAGQQSALSGQLGSAGISSMGKVAGGIGGGMAAAGAFGSDKRLKDNLKLLKVVDGYNIYSWDWNETAKDLFGYTGSAQGIIAQEVNLINPEAISEHKGYLVIDKTKLPVEVQEEINYGE